MRIWHLKSKDPVQGWVVDTCMRLTPQDVVALYDILTDVRPEWRGGHAELIEFTLQELDRLEKDAQADHLLNSDGARSQSRL